MKTVSRRVDPAVIVQQMNAEAEAKAKKVADAAAKKTKKEAPKQEDPEPCEEEKQEDANSEEEIVIKKSKPSRSIVEDEGNEDFYERNYSSLIQQMFRRPGPMDFDEYADTAMVAGFDDEEQEEAYSEKVGEYEDYLAEQEEMAEEERKKRKKQGKGNPQQPPQKVAKKAPPQALATKPSSSSKDGKPKGPSMISSSLQQKNASKTVMKPVDDIF